MINGGRVENRFLRIIALVLSLIIFFELLLFYPLSSINIKARKLVEDYALRIINRVTIPDKHTIPDEIVGNLISNPDLTSIKKEYYLVEFEGVVGEIDKKGSKNSPPGLTINTISGQKIISLSFEKNLRNPFNYQPRVFKIINNQMDFYSFDKIKEGDKVILGIRVDIKNQKQIFFAVTVL
jgi:hypothetical protein